MPRLSRLTGWGKLMEGVNLVVVSPLKGVPRPNQRILLTQKFLDGMGLYKEYWKGPIVLACEPAEQASDGLDNLEVDLDAVPFQTICEPLSDERLIRLFTPQSLVLTSVGREFNNIS